MFLECDLLDEVDQQPGFNSVLNKPLKCGSPQLGLVSMRSVNSVQTCLGQCLLRPRNGIIILELNVDLKSQKHALTRPKAV
jgi:hypothetical protein